MRRRSLPILVGSIALTLLAVIGVSVAGWRPLLGLDLQGGLSVVLRPAEDTDSEQLDQAIEIIRNRVDALGVAEPEISRQGGNIVVSLPGVKDQQRALDLVGTTAELRFRPVLQVLPGADLATAPAAGTEGEATTTTAPAVTPAGGESTTTAPGATTTAAPGSTTTTAAPPSGGQSSLGAEAAVSGSAGEVALGPTTTAAPATTTTAPPTTTAAPASGAAPGAGSTTDSTAPAATPATTSAPAGDALTSREEDLADRPVLLPGYDPEDDSVELYRYSLGPALATGEGVADAQMVLNPQTGEPYVQLTFKDGATGIDAWRAAAAACFGGSAQCPTGQLAIVLDGRVLSAPQVNDDFSDTQTAQITGQFTREEAQNLATALRYGALPVELERQQAQEVSATVGRDALRAGLVAGLIGLAVVSLYILAYYRLFGAVALASLALSFGLLWAIISWLGESRGLALSLSGVVGIIVSIGVSIDSNIVYFEVIKDDVTGGRTIPSATERAFRSAIRTILRADGVSLIGAGLLYWLTVGSVRGFAFYLGLATLLDLLASYVFMRPAASLLSRTQLARRRPTWFGIPPPRPPAVAGAGAGGGRRFDLIGGLRRLFRGENDYDFVRGWRIGLAVSGVLMVLSVASFAVRGVQRGIDFEGGTAWEVPTSELSVSEVRDLLRPLGQAEARIQTVGGDTVRVQSTTLSPEDTAAVRDALADGAGVATGDIAVTEVGPSWGSEISRKALRALVLFFVVIAVYISWTLREWRMAVGALAAVLHDIVLSVGVYSLFGVEVTPATVIAFLTILGFSLYDTVVVFDKIRENTPKVSVAGRMTYTEMASMSLNHVLMRSINTSLTALLPVLSILLVGAWIMGATTLEEFGLALLVGLVCGAYSSIFVATPIVAMLKEREPQYRQVRERLARRAGEPAPVGRVPVAAGVPLKTGAGAGAGRAGAGRARGGSDPDEGDGDPDDGADDGAVEGGEVGAIEDGPTPTAESADVEPRSGAPTGRSPTDPPPRSDATGTSGGAGGGGKSAAPAKSGRSGGRPLPPGYGASHPPRPRKKGRR